MGGPPVRLYGTGRFDCRTGDSTPDEEVLRVSVGLVGTREPQLGLNVFLDVAGGSQSLGGSPRRLPQK